MFKAIHCFLISILCFVSISVYASPRSISLVFLTFSDTTPYSEMKTNEVIDDFLLEELLKLNSVRVMERRVVKEALDAERQLSLSEKDVKAVVAANDFSTVFAAAENDLNSKTKGDSIPAKNTKVIGDKYHVNYILHGTIDYLGKGKNFMMVPLPHFFVSSINPYLEARVTLRLIEAQTGRIVWSHKERGVSRDSLYNLKDFTFGTGEFSNQLFVEAMKKISKKFAESLADDLEKGRVLLHRIENS